jgi:hypothetical protein
MTMALAASLNARRTHHEGSHLVAALADWGFGGDPDDLDALVRYSTLERLSDDSGRRCSPSSPGPGAKPTGRRRHSAKDRFQFGGGLLKLDQETRPLAGKDCRRHGRGSTSTASSSNPLSRTR